MPAVDTSYPPSERLPRYMVCTVTERPTPAAGLQTEFWVTAAAPSPHDSGGQTVIQTSDGGKLQGFRIGQTLCETISHGISPKDPYRFRATQYIANMALLGWSPTVRRQLNLQRWSDPAVAELEDGGRALEAETTMATMAVSGSFFSPDSPTEILSGRLRPIRNTILDSIIPTLCSNGDGDSGPTRISPEHLSATLRAGSMAMRVMHRHLTEQPFDETGVRSATVIADQDKPLLTVRVGNVAAFYSLSTRR